MRKNEIQRRRQELSDANADINATNRALDELRKITYEGRAFTREPHISDYYEATKEMEEYQTVAIRLTGLIGG